MFQARFGRVGLLFELGPVVGGHALQWGELANQITDRDVAEVERRLGRAIRTVGRQCHGDTVL